MNHEQIIASELGVRPAQVEAAIGLLDEGCTVPFVARYRKEVTGALDDAQLRTLETRLKQLRAMDERRETVLASIEEQGKLTDQLKKEILEAQTLARIEDLYLPYRPKRRTRATIAREKGLKDLADLIRLQSPGKDPLIEAAAYVKEEGASTVEEALDGACDILAEEIAEDAQIREWVREKTWKTGALSSSVKEKNADPTYENYFEYEEALKKIPGHRVLALDRGEREKVLSVKVQAPEEEILGWMERRLVRREATPSAAYLKRAAEDSYARLMAPSIENEIRRDLTAQAQEQAIALFGKNLTQLLMQPPVAGHTVLGWDPAFRTGCKLAVVDETGRVLETTVVYPTQPTTPEKIEKTKQVLDRLIRTYGITLISVGNGTASRESEQFLAAYLKERGSKVQYVIVSEAGASVYSASELGSKEFPNLDVGGRSAASIARRIQDPLAELVKIDPKAIGIGQYQHDMNQKRLSEALQSVVEDCVNKVGVDLNTASAPLLSYVSGVSATVAENIVTWRNENGKFTDRRQLAKVPRLGPKALQQCAGFLRIRDGKTPLDATGVHPESYEAARKLMEELGCTADQLAAGGIRGISAKVRNTGAKAAQLGIGEMTLKDILSELEKPGRDPRETLPPPILRSDVLEMEDLKEGMILKGTVRNIMDFGAFVDIGVHQDGLVHISQMSDSFIRHPLEKVSVGDIVTVRILGVDLSKKRISLSMKGVQ